MIGIYKITNKVNGHCYIGQSREIERRWNNHLSAARNVDSEDYNYPLYRAFRKYGIENFDFSVIEQCSISELNDREAYWISTYSPEYNQTAGGNYRIIPQKLTPEQVKEIQNLLISDPEGLLSHKILAEQYHVHKDTIRDINVGRTWRDDSLTYPLHYSQYDGEKPENMKKKYYCEACGKEISRGAKRCRACEDKARKEEAKENKSVSREELK